VAGWGFCYPATWKYNLRAQSVVSPPELDLVFDITDVPCTTPSARAGQTPRPVCATNAGLFGLMVVYTYERGETTSLSGWIQGNMNPAPSPGETISWGNAKEAMKLSNGRRIALTSTHVVVLELRSGAGNLDLEAAMAPRLDTWKFLA